MAERWHARLTRILDHELSSRQPLIMYASSSDFQQTNVVSGQLGEGTGGVTESLRRRSVLPFAGPLADTDHVIGHELVHAFQYDISARQTRGNRRVAGDGNQTREISLRDLDGAVNASWSPDGRQIALIGMTGGLTDLFLLDLESGALTRVTNDPFAELQPAWSPDGRRIAFATDRFTTTLDAADTGSFRLGDDRRRVARGASRAGVRARQAHRAAVAGPRQPCFSSRTRAASATSIGYGATDRGWRRSRR